jgi:hypothetical protein
MPERQEFDSTAIAVTSASLATVYDILCSGHPVLLEGLVGAGGALGSFQLQVKATSGGTFDAWKTDADFNTPTQQMPELWGSAYPATPIHQTPADGRFKILMNLPGAHTIRVRAAKTTTDTTLRITGAIYSRGFGQ